MQMHTRRTLCFLWYAHPTTCTTHNTYISSFNSPIEGAFASSFAESHNSRVQIELSEPAFARLIAYCYTNRIAPPPAPQPSREVLYELAEASEFFAYAILCVV